MSRDAAAVYDCEQQYEKRDPLPYEAPRVDDKGKCHMKVRGGAGGGGHRMGPLLSQSSAFIYQETSIGDLLLEASVSSCCLTFSAPDSARCSALVAARCSLQKTKYADAALFRGMACSQRRPHSLSRKIEDGLLDWLSFPVHPELDCTGRMLEMHVE